MPWANVIANPQFGTIVTASGAAHTWSGNSRENRSDAVRERSDQRSHSARRFFVRDDETGESWSPTPGPLRREAPRAADASSATRQA